MKAGPKCWRTVLVVLGFISLIGAVFPVPEINPSSDGIVAADVAWMLTATGLVLLMTPGLAFFYGGMVGSKNAVSTMLQSFVALGVISILWIVVGFSIAFGDSVFGLFGNPFHFFMFRNVSLEAHDRIASNLPLALFALFQLKFAIITPALITGSFAERVRFSAYLLFISLYSIFIYAPLAHWTWHPDGFLYTKGVLDFAGGTVVHISAGCAALAGAMVLGSRNSLVTAKEQRPYNIPFVMLGAGMLWFGWFGFNAGSALAANQTAVKAFLNTNTASAAACVAWLFYDGYKGRKLSAVGACIGAVVGLVAITPAAGYVTVGQSLFIGTVSSLISSEAVYWKNKSGLDDTLDVFPCHGIGGIVGMILTAVFAKTEDSVGLIYGGLSLFLSHIIALVIVVLYCFIGSFILYTITDSIIPLRVTDEQEEEGLDMSQHGESAVG